MTLTADTKPLVSAIIPAFNRPKQLLIAIRSVLDQDYPNLELIVIDDASTEDLSEVKSIVTNWHTLPKNSGPATARNFGRSKAKGKYLAFLDSDDYWLPQKITKQVALHQNEPSLQISQCREIWYRDGKRVNPAKKHEMFSGDLFPKALHYCVISSSSVFMTSALFDRYGGYPAQYRVCEDYAFWLKITAAHPVGLITERLTVKHGGHADQLSKSEPALDRYRLQALLEEEDNPALSREQKSLLREAILEKARILKQGAIKRSLPCDPYDRIISNYGN